MSNLYEIFNTIKGRQQKEKDELSEKHDNERIEIFNLMFDEIFNASCKELEYDVMEYYIFTDIDFDVPLNRNVIIITCKVINIYDQNETNYRFYYNSKGEFSAQDYNLNDVINNNSEIIKFEVRDKYVYCKCDIFNTGYISFKNYEKIKLKYDKFIKEVELVADKIQNKD